MRDWIICQGGNKMSYEDYIDDYYETAMEAEREYIDFLDVAIELYKELQATYNIVYKNIENFYYGVVSLKA